MGFMGYQGQDQRIREDSETGDTDHNNRLGGAKELAYAKSGSEIKQKCFDLGIYIRDDS